MISNALFAKSSWMYLLDILCKPQVTGAEFVAQLEKAAGPSLEARVRKPAAYVR